MSRFVSDPEDFRRPGEPRPVIVARDLLEELGVFDAPRQAQERAVQQWLRDNEPSEVLAASLEDLGLLPARPARGDKRATA